MTFRTSITVAGVLTGTNLLLWLISTTSFLPLSKDVWSWTCIGVNGIIVTAMYVVMHFGFRQKAATPDDEALCLGLTLTILGFANVVLSLNNIQESIIPGGMIRDPIVKSWANQAVIGFLSCFLGAWLIPRLISRSRNI